MTLTSQLWIGRVLSALAALFLLFDAVVKLLGIAPVVEAFQRLGYPVEVAFEIGSIELVCTALYLIPPTSRIGAVLQTGFLGGAISTHVRVSDPLLSHTLFPMYVGLMVWGGLYLRDRRLDVLLPWKA